VVRRDNAKVKYNLMPLLQTICGLIILIFGHSDQYLVSLGCTILIFARLDRIEDKIDGLK